MERLVENGSCKAIGVSDFTLEQLEEIVRSARIMPAVSRWRRILITPSGNCSTSANNTAS